MSRLAFYFLALAMAATVAAAIATDVEPAEGPEPTPTTITETPTTITETPTTIGTAIMRDQDGAVYEYHDGEWEQTGWDTTTIQGE